MKNVLIIEFNHYWSELSPQKYINFLTLMDILMLIFTVYDKLK